MARDYHPLQSQVKFVEVPVTDESASIHQGLGVPSLPYVHVYHPQAGLVEEMGMTRKHFPQVQRKVQEYVDGMCSVNASFSSPYDGD